MNIFSSVPELIAAIQMGEMVILVDDEGRENEGDLVMAAEKVTPEAINFMITEGRGFVCLPMTADRCAKLKLPLMVENNQDKFGTNFTVSIEAAKGVSTGVSVQDRVKTILTAVHPDSTAVDLVRPGHIFPLQAHPKGVLGRTGHTEASCELVRLAGLAPAAVICEIMNKDGSMARQADLIIFAKKNNLKIGMIKDLVAYKLVELEVCI